MVGKQWDDLSEFPILGTREIWEFENPTNSMHPMHVHLVKFQVMDKVSLGSGQAIPLEPWESITWKDTVRVPPQSRVRIIMDFEDYLGKFPYHCHILDHEDHEMMRQFQSVNNPYAAGGCATLGTCTPGNGVCEAGEDCRSVPVDCSQVSGALCGNGLCEASDGENCVTCAADCAGKQQGSAAKQFCCGFDDGEVTNPVGCGIGPDDARCIDATTNTFCRVAPRVPACCGDAMCEGAESSANCVADCFDTDSDGVPDAIDSDDDNDGVPDIRDAFPLDPSESVDTDGDGFGNNADPDDDNDGLYDVDEAPAGTDPLAADSDGDGIVDGLDPDPASASNHVSCKNPEDGLPLTSVSFTDAVASAVTCAATQSITLQPPASLQAGGNLILIAPEVVFDPQTMAIYVQIGGVIEIISTDPTALIPNPPP